SSSCSSSCHRIHKYEDIAESSLKKGIDDGTGEDRTSGVVSVSAEIGLEGTIGDSKRDTHEIGTSGVDGCSNYGGGCSSGSGHQTASKSSC
ncbi:hypothetical protein PMAYCL1PPCAC_17994, partial [Pristionchus mayeri]